MASSCATIDIVAPIDRQFAVKSRFPEGEGVGGGGGAVATSGQTASIETLPIAPSSHGPELVTHQPVKGK